MPPEATKQMECHRQEGDDPQRHCGPGQPRKPEELGVRLHAREEKTYNTAPEDHAQHQQDARDKREDDAGELAARAHHH